MTIADIAACLESIAPLSLQEQYDNAGFLTGDPAGDCTGVLCTLDVTEAVVEEASRRNCNCIVAHHPLIFRGLKTLAGTGYVEKTVLAAIRSNVTIYASHTNLDNVAEGVNARIAGRIGLLDRRLLSEVSPGVGAGMIGQLPATLEADGFLALLKDRFGTGAIRYCGGHNGPIRRVAVCGGSGSFLISRALTEGADAFVTADIKYHDFFTPAGRMMLCDIGHYESEQFTVDLLVEILLQKFPTFAVLKSEVKTNPVRYFTGI